MADSWTYRIFVGTLMLFGLVAIIASAVGVHTVLTGGTAEGPPEVEELGAFGCEEFDADPPVPHGDSHGAERTLLSGSVLVAVNGTTTDEGFRIVFVVDEQLLETSASRADGSTVPVERIDEENRVIVEGTDTTPFRLWIDTVDDDATVSRTQLDICPPG